VTGCRGDKLNDVNAREGDYSRSGNSCAGHILASLKSLLETGQSLEETREWLREARK